jgi:uncharacterized protein
MRNLLLATTVALFLAAPLWAATMPADVGAGHVAWFDLTTTDLAKSKDFYEKLLGWTFAPLAGTDQAVEIVAGKKGIGTLRGTEGAISGFNGVVYIQVKDLPAKVARAKELGATIVPGFPFDLPDKTGAIALLTDPSGHPVGLYSRAQLPPAKKAP